MSAFGGKAEQRPNIARRIDRLPSLLPLAVHLLQPFQERVDVSIGAAEHSRVHGLVMFTDDQRNAEFVSPAQEPLSAGTQHCFQCLEAKAGDWLFADQRIV
jgi:hypothetical protein